MRKIYLVEQKQYAATTINLRLAAVRRVAFEAADAGLLSPEPAAGIRRVKGVRRVGLRVGNWLSFDRCFAMKYLIPPSSQTAVAEIYNAWKCPAAEYSSVCETESWSYPWNGSPVHSSWTYGGKQMASERTLSAHAGPTPCTARIILMSIVLWSLTAGHISGDSPTNPTNAKPAKSALLAVPLSFEAN